MEYKLYEMEVFLWVGGTEKASTWEADSESI